MQFIFAEKSLPSKYVSQSINIALAIICIPDVLHLQKLTYISSQTAF